jgi:hypothetical protein
MKNIKKIGWQKYEDYIEKQMSSPILNNILQNIMSLQQSSEIDELNEIEDDEDEDEDYDDIEDKKHTKIISPFLPLTNQIMDDIAMLSSFDCWIGHTNFDITPPIKNILDSVPGIELLKIYSRYRFFIGIGKMFDFTDVRKIIEDSLIGDDNDE